MDVKQNEPFTYRGLRLIAKRTPHHMWPCQACRLKDLCGDPEAAADMPACRSENREDNENVVFYEFTPGRRQA